MVLLAALLAAPASTREPAASGDERAGLALLDSIEAANADLVDLAATFTEVTFLPMFEESLTARGEIFFKRPGRLVLRYAGPDSSLLVVEDRTVWLHQPEMRQAHRFVLSEESTAYGILMGFGGRFTDARKHFRFFAGARDGARGAGRGAGKGGQRDEPSPRERVIRAVPRPGSGAAEDLEEIVIVVDAARWLPLRTRFREAGGDERLFVFGPFRRNVGLPDSVFAFVPPPGTEVLEMSR